MYAPDSSVSQPSIYRCVVALRPRVQLRSLVRGGPWTWHRPPSRTWLCLRRTAARRRLRCSGSWGCRRRSVLLPPRTRLTAAAPWEEEEEETEDGRLRSSLWPEKRLRPSQAAFTSCPKWPSTGRLCQGSGPFKVEQPSGDVRGCVCVLDGSWLIITDLMTPSNWLFHVFNPDLSIYTEYSLFSTVVTNPLVWSSPSTSPLSVWSSPSTSPLSVWSSPSTSPLSVFGQLILNGWALLSWCHGASSSVSRVLLLFHTTSLPEADITCCCTDASQRKTI